MFQIVHRFDDFFDLRHIIGEKPVGGNLVERLA
jgi:hypothetical protein